MNPQSQARRVRSVDLDKIHEIEPFVKTYGQPTVENAVAVLKKYYKDHHFYDDDIARDFDPDDYKNCHGIHVFVDALANNTGPDEVNGLHPALLFRWIVHILLGGPEPGLKPQPITQQHRADRSASRSSNIPSVGDDDDDEKKGEN